MVGTTAYVLWALLFLKTRRRIDVLRFQAQARNQGSIIQLIQGMQDIKLSNSEQQKRWDWEKIQAALFRGMVAYLIGPMASSLSHLRLGSLCSFNIVQAVNR